MSDCVYPCPCGYFQDAIKECTCFNSVNTRYQKRISGPMLDRIHTHIEVPRVDYEKLNDDRLGEPSANVQARVEAARERQRARFNGTNPPPGGNSNHGITCNADMHPAQIRQYCQLDETSNALMRSAMNQMPAVFSGAFGAGLSPGTEISPHDRRSSRGRKDRHHPSRRGLAVPTEVGDDVIKIIVWRGATLGCNKI